jgi:hypothetical protein
MVAGLRPGMFAWSVSVRGGTGSSVGCARRWLSMASKTECFWCGQVQTAYPHRKFCVWCASPLGQPTRCLRNTDQPCYCRHCQKHAKTLRNNPT